MRGFRGSLPELALPRPLHLTVEELPGDTNTPLVLVAFVEAMQEIGGLGIEIKDFERGLCDFPHLRDGRVVYLCWQKGEDAIEWWHDIEAGFAGRQPL